MKPHIQALILAALAAALLSAPLEAAPVAANNGDIVLGPVAGDGPRLDSPVQPSLIGGRDANAADWPATVYSSQGSSRCTATLVAARALLIAAHCVGDGKTATFTAGGKQYSSTCKHSPDYRRDHTADWALCYVATDVAGVAFEKLAKPEDAPQVGETILLTGYGCTRAGGSGGNDGVYRIGESTVISVPTRDNDIVTKGGAALCYGDSGGPAFRLLDPEGKERVQVSVNSRGDIRTTSYLSSITTAKAVSFIESWAQEKRVRICGIHAEAGGCRGVQTPPPAQPLPTWCTDAWTVMTACLWATPQRAKADPEGCRDAYATLFACEEIAEREDGR